MMLSPTDKDDLGESPEEETLLALRIKSSSLGDQTTVDVSSHADIESVKQRVRNAMGPTAQGRYLRLICKGRLLAPDSAQLGDFGVTDGDILHAVLAADGVRGGQQAALARGSSRRYRGTGVGPQGRVLRRSNSRHEDTDSEVEDTEEGRERLGFDRLRASGLSRAEITALRSYFNRHVDRYVQQNPNVVDEEDGVRRRLLQEDAWMQGQGPTSEFRLNLNHTNPLMAPSAILMRTTVGTDRDFLWGFLLGFFVGFLMLVWVWMPTVPHKQKLGILFGISLQLALSLLRSNGDESELDMD